MAVDERDRYLALAKRSLELARELRELQAEVMTLKVFVLFVLHDKEPDEIASILEALREIQANVLKGDQSLEASRQAFDTIDALQKLKMRGGSGMDS